MKLQHLVGVCLFCGRQTVPYDPTESRVCCTMGLTRDVEKSFGSSLKLYPTIYPVPAERNSVFAPPDPRVRPVPDVFAISTESETIPAEPNCLPALPYPDNSDIEHLRCGNATLHNLGNLSTNFGFTAGNITVCDMATYLWSNTLKDPRSWAVIRTALASGVRHLGVWTAGNAGLSLAKLAYTVNRLRPPNQRINVYCYGVRGELPVDLQRPLQEFRAHVTILNPIGGKIFQPDQALERLNANLPENMRIQEREYWDVSDGWDGVALYMYRLLGRQICLHRKPRYIVAPLGTGDLFFGLYQGRQDCLNNNLIGPTDCRLVAAVPLGASIMNNYKTHQLEFSSVLPSVGRGKPIAPKVAASYTPLLLVMYPALRDQSVTVVQVSKEEQDSAADLLIAKGTQSWIAAEPSALLAFAALPGIASRHLTEQGHRSGDAVADANAKVVVVNTGCGSLGNEERAFVGSYLGNAGAA